MFAVDQSRYGNEYDIEMNAIDMGIARYRQLRQTSLATEMTPEQRFIATGMRTLVPAVEALQAQVVAQERVRGIRKWGLPMLCLPADKLALITLITIFNSGEHQTYTKTSLEVASSCKAERIFALIKKTAPDIVKRMTFQVKRWNKRAVANAKAQVEGVDVDWDLATRTWLGSKLVETALLSTNLFEYNSKDSFGKTYTKIRITEAVRCDLEKQHGSSELLSPFYLPMVIPPSDWAAGKQGGYLYHKTRLVKTPHILEEDYDARYESVDQLVYDAINALQATPWRIHKTVLEVAGTLWQAGGNLAGLPPRHLLPVPPKPADIDTNEDALVAWCKAASAVHDANANLISARKSALTKMKIADRFKDFDRIWFPWDLDWRGRAYPKPSELNPHGDDLGRGLLEFSEGKPLGPSGYWWLTQHVAGLLGKNKTSLQESYDTVHKIDATSLVQWAADPLTHRGWMDFDDPFKLLAAAIEWAAAYQSKDRESFVSRIPVAVDGTCNGLQHFSALGRDAVGGKATNLIPGETPEDIYRQVADVVNTKINEDAENGVLTAQAWKGRVTRSVVKRAVMTTPYNVTRQGIRMQFITDGHTDGLPGEINANANYLRDVVYDAVGQVVIAARAIMDWLIEAARLTSEAGLAIRYTTPVGFPVYQEYLEQKCRSVETVLQRIQLREPHPSRTICGESQMRGMTPNFIHSLDAAHMMCTVLGCSDVGVWNLSMVHDSFATYAADVDALNTVLREQFVEMHSLPIMEQFKERIEKDTAVVLPPLPRTGELDLSAVKDSLYFFHP